MIMKIQKPEQQLPNLKALSYSPMSSASISCERQVLAPFSESSLEDFHPVTLLDTPPQLLSENELYPGEETCELSSVTNLNGMEDSGGGGTGVKKKRKKKEQGEEKETKPKKKKEPKKEKVKETKKVKEAKEPRQPKNPKEPKKSRKPKEPKPPKEKKANSDTVPKPKSKKTSKEQGPTPVEKKKKGKRKAELCEDSLEGEFSMLNSGSQSTEESTESLDSQKRRSGRQVKRRKYNEDLDFKVVDDDGETIAVLGAGRASALSASTLAWQAEEPPEDDANIIERILSSRIVQKGFTPEGIPLELEEFYVKYRNFSYLHCKWATLEDLEKDPRIQQKIKRFRNKQAQMKLIFTEPDEDMFNPDYVEVDRILEVAHTKDSDTGEEVTHYLVKWCSLSYEESTWELEEDVDQGKVREFEALQVLPDVNITERPSSESWQKLECSRTYKNNNQLREYQLEGMNWLLFNWYNRKNCILADEMGLGKTIQSITFLSEIFFMGIRGPFLIIAPLSTITNWEREFRTWTEMNTVVYHGSQISRQMIHQYEMSYRDVQGVPVPGVFKFHVVITTFEMILADCPELKKIRWSGVIIDEAHRLKNKNCKLLEGLKLMGLEHKVLLTGTPLQNSVEELYSLLNFLEPNQFPCENTFLEEFGDLKTEEQVKKLQSILKPMMLRRLKDDVEKNLAPKQETIIEVELTNIQKKYYRAILEKNFTFLAKGANQHNMPNLINTMMELRKCCNHPYLINGAEEKILEDFRKTHSPDASDFQLQAMIQAAGKLVLIDKLLPKLIIGGHKVLIFSQMVRCLDILEDYLIQRRYTYERIDGRVRGNLRQAAIDRFCKPDSDRFVFLLCTRAGGLGINLTAADTCIIFDSDWNPQNDLQAQARCHRIGQSKAVKVYRLITRNSYEREMFDKASLKLGLDKAVLQDINRKGNTNGVQPLSKIEVEDLLRKGAYGALMDEEDEGSKFCEEDIDQILQRRTQTITIQSEGKGSTFAKASFVSSGNRTDISLDDPNFWQKWAKIAELDTDAKNEKDSLVIDRPRVRKQTKHYNSFEDDELMEFSELESDTEERPTRSRRLNDKTRRYLRAECFRVEKNLLIFGWGRWKDILTLGRFKWHLNEKDMEMICRALLVYCVKHYKGDEKIKSFIWDLITPTKDGYNQALQNHSGLSAPVPRGRKGKKMKNQMLLPEIKNADWLASCNPEIVLHDDSYKKHLKQHCNKVLLRVRMLYYLKAEVLGGAAGKALEGVNARDLVVLLPEIDYVEIPVDWWDAEADKSLLVGVYKHGYERYCAMRADPALCFLEKVGMPDKNSLSADGVNDVAPDVAERSGEEKEENSESKQEYQQEVEKNPSTNNVEQMDEESNPAQDSPESDRLLWPVASALTARLRRLITVYQRCNRKELARPEILAPTSHSYWLQEEMVRRAEMDPIMKEMQKRWTRREQADFYRTVSSFGVIYDADKKCFDWMQFRSLSRLDKKTDESLEKYFHSFVAMCRNVCRLPLRKDDGSADPSLFLDPITEERAARTLYRIELLRKVREQVLRHPQLPERLKLCRPSLYLPVWWECGKHDRDLLIGTAKHGLSRTDYYIMNDPQLSFLDAYRNYSQHKKSGGENMCCHYQMASKVFEASPCHLEGTNEAERTEAEIKSEAVDEPIESRMCSPQDLSCENLISQVGDMMSNSQDECSLPDSLMCMMYDEKTCNSSLLQASTREQTSLAASFMGMEKSAPTDYTRSKTKGGNLTPEEEPVSRDCFLGSNGQECDPLEGQDTLGKPFNSNHSHLSLSAGDEEQPQTPNIGEKDSETLNDDHFCTNLDQSAEQSLGLEFEFLDKTYEEPSGLSTSLNEEKSCGIIGESPQNSNCNLPVEEKEEWGAELQEIKDDPIVKWQKELDDMKELPIEECGDEHKVKDLGVQTDVSKSEENCTAQLLDDKDSAESKHKTGEMLSGLLKQNAEDLKDKDSEEKPDCSLSDGNVKLEVCEIKKENIEEDCGCKKDTTHYGRTWIWKSEPTELLGKYPEEEAKSCTISTSKEVAQEFPDGRAPTIAQLLQEKTLYSFSEWPKDRVVINRIDNICHSVLKGKWPSSSQQFEAQCMVPSVLNSNLCPRSSYSTAEAQNATYSNGSPASHGQKETFTTPTFSNDERKHRRPFEFDSERADAKPRGMQHLGTPLGRTSAALNGWRETAMELCREQAAGGSSTYSINSSTPKMAAMTGLQGSLGMDLSGILQAGLIHPVTGQIVNGSLRRDETSLRRRRGRRKNVEGMDLVFLKDRGMHAGIVGLREEPAQLSSTHTEGSVTSSHSATASKPQAEKVIPNKSLLEWLRQQSDCTIDIPTYAGSFSDKPKPRRQRCKDPSKVDISILTGEDRISVANKDTGRRGFLPETKFGRVLSDTIVCDTGPRRRGRRPRSDLIKTPGVVGSDTSLSGMNPLFMNGLIAGMDIVGLQNMRNMQGIPLTGLVGFPTGFTTVSANEDVKSTLSMLPMMLPGMAAMPQMFGVGGIINPPLSSSLSSSLGSTIKGGATHGEKATEDKDTSQVSTQDSTTSEKTAGTPFKEQTDPAVTASCPVAFNPFLIPGMSPSLLYPSMFLSPGIGMAIPGVQSSHSSEAGGHEPQKRKRKKVKGDPQTSEPESAPFTQSPDQELPSPSGQNYVDTNETQASEKDEDDTGLRESPDNAN
ncbi:chromodomain-helicase-DNA-binding protein 6 isoform X1 [Phyllobates terribilis]|uniref:chromodomain-helicase-DNA-binding protein 6 isoform X1 n=1 Tax=Phyllobates terribilis TaxID=111132 RepID=UPI003CCB4C69